MNALSSSLQKIMTSYLGTGFSDQPNAPQYSKSNSILQRQAQKGGGENGLSFGDSRTEMAKR